MDTKAKNGKRTAVPVKRVSGTASGKKNTGKGSAARQGGSAPRKKPQAPEPPRVTPEVVYLAPKPFSRNRLILRLVTVVAVVLALMLGLSVFFRVENIQVSGCEKYSAWDVQQASGIELGDQLLTFNRARAAGKIIADLTYVKSVRIGISLPDTVNIEITELRVSYSIEAQDGSWWLVSSDGKVVEQIQDGSQNDHTRILGVSILNPVPGEPATAYQNAADERGEDGSTIPVTVTAQQKLNTAVDIAEYLEMNNIIGQMETINVENLWDIELWYGTKFRILLGDTTDLNNKISCTKGFLDDYTQNRPYESGTLDVSDVNWIEYQSFS